MRRFVSPTFLGENRNQAARKTGFPFSHVTPKNKNGTSPHISPVCFRRKASHVHDQTTKQAFDRSVRGDVRDAPSSVRSLLAYGDRSPELSGRWPRQPRLFGLASSHACLAHQFPSSLGLAVENPPCTVRRPIGARWGTANLEDRAPGGARPSEARVR